MVDVVGDNVQVPVPVQVPHGRGPGDQTVLDGPFSRSIVEHQGFSALEDVIVYPAGGHELQGLFIHQFGVVQFALDLVVGGELDKVQVVGPFGDPVGDEHILSAVLVVIPKKGAPAPISGS